jgi:Alginate export
MTTISIYNLIYKRGFFAFSGALFALVSLFAPIKTWGQCFFSRHGTTSTSPRTGGSPAQRGATPEGVICDVAMRHRLEHDTWHALKEVKRRSTFSTTKIQFGVGYNQPQYRLYGQGQYFSGINLPENGAGTAGGYFGENGHSHFGDLGLRQANMTLYQTGNLPVKLTVGRFLYSSGEERPSFDPNVLWLQNARIAQRLIGVADFTAGRSFDGIRVDRSDEPHLVTFVMAHPSQGGNQADVNPTITDVDIVTAVYTYSQDSLHAQVFYYYFGDSRGAIPTDNRQIEVRQTDLERIALNTFGGGAVKIFEFDDGEYIDTVAWIAGQQGEWGSLSHRALAGVLEGGYQFRDIPWKPWFRTGWNYSTGDEDNSDGMHTTFSQLISTARRYAQTPFYNMQNMSDVFFQAIVQPATALRVRHETHWLSLAENSDLLYFGGGPNVKSRFGMGGLSAHGPSSVGLVTDIDVTYEFSPHLSSTIYVGHLFPADVPDALYPPRRRDITYAFWDLNVKF